MSRGEARPAARRRTPDRPEGSSSSRSATLPRGNSEACLAAGHPGRATQSGAAATTWTASPRSARSSRATGPRRLRSPPDPAQGRARPSGCRRSVACPPASGKDRKLPPSARQWRMVPGSDRIPDPAGSSMRPLMSFMALSHDPAPDGPRRDRAASRKGSRRHSRFAACLDVPGLFNLEGQSSCVRCLTVRQRDRDPCRMMSSCETCCGLFWRPGHCDPG